ncbi:MAG: glycosyltransferase [Bacteroides sp.]|nr:glycosyltransferase [Bacteroides sp.]MCM1447844.1 glycosyltransferase [Bacteroides sp.]
MKVIFLSNFYPRCRRDHYLSRSKSGLASAADAHQYAIALGLRDMCDDFTIINSPSIFPYPMHYMDKSIPSEIIEENGLTINNVGASTLMEYQFISRYKNVYAELEKIVSKTPNKVYIVVYATNNSLMKAATKIKKAYKNVKLCLIVPDLPEDMQTNSGLVTKLLWSYRNLYFGTPAYYYAQFDSFVLLTKYMQEKIGCRDDQFIVSEGVYEEQTVKREAHSEDGKKFNIFYGGMLHEKFGINNLLDAFSMIGNPSIHLTLCGTGDCVERIKEMTASNPRLHYLGVVPRDVALAEQTKASLLVNPRMPDGNPFTRYSFPSKTMEYLASGTPALIYQLDGIPSEYYDLCYTLDKDHLTPQDLVRKILNIYNNSLSERLELANKARQFIIENKNAQIAGKQIFELLKRTM